MGSIDWKCGFGTLHWKVWSRGMLLCFLLSALSFQPVRAQTWSEWFRQKKTEERYLLKQVAYLKLYGGYLKKGYELASSGLGTIRGITSGEMGLHEAFFASLKLVSPVVRNDVRIVEIAEMQLQLSGLFRAVERSKLSGESMAYVSAVCRELRRECGLELDELLQLVTSSRLEMDDGQRLERLAGLHASMLVKLEFTKGFYGEVQSLEGAVEKELSELKWLGRFYGRE